MALGVKERKNNTGTTFTWKMVVWEVCIDISTSLGLLEMTLRLTHNPVKIGTSDFNYDCFALSLVLLV